MDQYLIFVIEFCTSLAMSLSYGFMITYLVLWGRAMPEHAYFMLLFVAVFSTLAALLIAALRKVYYVLTKAPDLQELKRPINQTYYKFPIPQLIGFFLMLNYVTAGFGSPHVSGILQAVLTQGSIPFTIVMSYVLLRRRYIWLQLLGAAVVIGGALLTMEKDLTAHTSGCDAASNSSTMNDTFKFECLAVEQTLMEKNVSSVCIANTNSILWDFLYFISTLPIGLVNIINEYFLQYSKGNDVRRAKAGELNVPIAVALSNIWLFIWLLLFFWLNLLPDVVPQCADVPRSMHVFGLNMRTALKCTFGGHGGFTGAIDPTALNDTAGLHYKDHCDDALTFVIMLALAATVQMILQAYTVQQQSATFTMALVTLGPVFAVFFQNSKGLTGSFHDDVKTTFSGFMTAGLVVVLLGILMYKLPEMFRFFNVLPSLHPIETDDSQSWIHKKLSSILRYYIRQALRENGSDDLHTTPLDVAAGTGSDSDDAPKCC